MKYLFILGRNIKLSVIEVLSYLEREDITVKEHSVRHNALLVDMEETLDADAINSLGGVISIGIVLSSGDYNEVISGLDKQELYSGEKNNMTYFIWDFSEDPDKIKDYLKARFKSEKLRASEKIFTKSLRSQDGEEINNVGSKLVDEQYFILEIPGKEINFGRIVQKCDYAELEKRDMLKPVRRENLAISPRLAKIMINLSLVKSRGMLLDCFCGIGVVLEEALLQDLKVVGVDKDKEAISGAKQNFIWFKSKEKDYDLINEDSSRVKLSKVDVLVTEPDLGETLKKIPTKDRAKTQLKEYEELMIKVLNNLKSNVGGRFVFTAPHIRIMNKRIACNVERIANESGLRVVKGFPINEYRENQIVGRQIIVMEK
jgi:tRNA G10  N-methylase Trm11